MTLLMTELTLLLYLLSFSTSGACAMKSLVHTYTRTSSILEAMQAHVYNLGGETINTPAAALTIHTP